MASQYPPPPEPYGQPFGQPYGQPAYPGYAPAAPPQNGPGTWALVLGLLSIFCFSILTGIPAIVLGVKGRRLARERRATNGGMATAGLVLGILSIVFAVLGAVIFALTAATISTAFDEAQGDSGTVVAPAVPSAAGEEPAEDTGLPEGVYHFGDTVRFEDGSTLTATGPEEFQRDEFAAGGEDFKSHVKFKVTFVNGTDEVFDPSLSTGSMSSGDTEGDSVFQTGLDAPENSLLPGKSVTWFMGYGTNDPAQATLTVSMGFMDGYDDVIFTNED